MVIYQKYRMGTSEKRLAGCELLVHHPNDHFNAAGVRREGDPLARIAVAYQTHFGAQFVVGYLHRFYGEQRSPRAVGEVLRPFILTKKENIKFSTSFATVIMERIFDMLGLILFTVVVIALLPHPSAPQPNTLASVSANQVGVVNESILPSLKKWTEVFAALGVITLASLFSVVMKPDFFRQLLSKFCFFLPHTLKDRILGMYESFVYGLKILEDKTQAGWAMALSIFIWILGGAEIYLLGFSFHMHLPFVAACLVAVCLALAVALPQAPGYIGVFHIAVLKSLHLFGIETTAAQSYAIVLWAISILPSTIMGFLFLWREGIAFREVVKLEGEIIEGKLEEMEGVTREIR
ncbi:MAG: hypothetical protein BROFUL_01598 [Candidatus Brocadia fulgida]|uniref:Flippase-like domain-containing protein n=1 Tax=Candidatus Brocadia fulgida TaxID=380242 RepID=A0A0M2UXH8_9BACT|nr:MAG: hypothetical protein BROFUL_01598 [Candidatus Brocadia fulgida]